MGTKRKVKRPTTWLNPKRKTKLVRKKVARMKRVTNRRLRIGQRKRRGKKIRKGRSPETEAEIVIKKRAKTKPRMMTNPEKTRDLESLAQIAMMRLRRSGRPRSVQR